MKGQVDIIICETMSSIREGKIASEIALKEFDEVWLSWNTRGVLMDQNYQVENHWKMQLWLEMRLELNVSF